MENNQVLISTANECINLCIQYATELEQYPGEVFKEKANTARTCAGIIAEQLKIRELESSAEKSMS